MTGQIPKAGSIVFGPLFPEPVLDPAHDSLLRSTWERGCPARKMRASSSDHKTLACLPGESLSNMTDHFLLMTAPPHKGDHDTPGTRLFSERIFRDREGAQILTTTGAAGGRDVVSLCLRASVVTFQFARLEWKSVVRIGHYADEDKPS
ncbi:MAG: hypothetical protein WCK47_10020 [bacterium]